MGKQRNVSRVDLYKADDLSEEVRGVQINIAQEPTDCKYDFREQGTKLADALFASLPGGTIDALLIELLERTKSRLQVRHRVGT